jgi:hypothetical protein
MRLVQQGRYHETGASENYDVRSAVRQLLIDSYLGNASDCAGVGELRGAVHRSEAKPPVTLQAVSQHPFVPGLEDV